MSFLFKPRYNRFDVIVLSLVMWATLTQGLHLFAAIGLLVLGSTVSIFFEAMLAERKARQS